MLVTSDQLAKVYQACPKAKVALFTGPINQTLEKFAINTPPRIQMFLAQIGHESGELRYTEELASGKAYEGRKDLGNTTPGDGMKYKGRGLIQITGKRNYVLCGLALDLPLLEKPELLKEPENACLSAGWYWQNSNLNALADLGRFDRITRVINGGTNGAADRQRLYLLAQRVIL